MNTKTLGSYTGCLKVIMTGLVLGACSPAAGAVAADPVNPLAQAFTALFITTTILGGISIIAFGIMAMIAHFEPVEHMKRPSLTGLVIAAGVLTFSIFAATFAGASQ